MNPSTILAAALAALAMPAQAAQKTVVLAVPGMSCGACPITVKTALNKVDGVEKIEVDLDKRQATVTFDHARTDEARLTRATADAGYPSSVQGTNR